MTKHAVGMGYDAPRAYEQLIAPRYAPIAEALVAAAKPKKTDQALELGAGTGLLTRLTVGRVKSLVATDVSTEMLSVAKRRARGATIATLDYSEPFPFDDASFDLVLSCLTYAQESTATVTEVARVLKPGGRFAVAQWGNGYLEQRLLSETRREFLGKPYPSPAPGRQARRLEHAGFSIERLDFRLEPEFASVDDYITYRRGFGVPLGATPAYYDRFLKVLARNARDAAELDGRLLLGWCHTILVGTLPR